MQNKGNDLPNCEENHMNYVKADVSVRWTAVSVGNKGATLSSPNNN